MRRAFSVTALMAVLLGGLFGIGQAASPQQATSVGTGSDGSVASYQIQKTGWGPIPSVKVYKWGRQMVFTKSQTKAAVTQGPPAFAYLAGGGFIGIVISGYSASWLGDELDKRGKCLVLSQPWPMAMYGGGWVPSSRPCSG